MGSNIPLGYLEFSNLYMSYPFKCPYLLFLPTCRQNKISPINETIIGVKIVESKVKFRKTSASKNDHIVDYYDYFYKITKIFYTPKTKRNVR